MNIPLFIVASLFIVAGFWGVLIPVIPDLPLIWLGIFIYALGTGFVEVQLTTALLLGIMAASTYLVDYLSTALGAKRYGASPEGMMGAVIGGLLGFFFFPPFGFLPGTILGTLFAEFVLKGRSWSVAMHAGRGALIGLLFGLVAKVLIAGMMIGVFLQSVL